MRDFISEFRPEGWVEMETKMDYHTNEAKWGREGVPEADIAKIVQSRVNKRPTNADFIAYLYNHIEVDNPKIPGHIYYRWCKRPITAEVFRML